MLDDITRAARHRYLGSSDAAAIVGRDAFGRTSYDVWLEKTGRIPAQPANAAMSVGQYLEGGILDWTAAKLETILQRDQFRIHPDGILAANCDALALDLAEPAIIEAKTVGLFARPKHAEDWGAAETDEVPAHVLIQVHHQLAVLADEQPPIHRAYVPALISGRGIVLYVVPREDALSDVLVAAETRFWRDHVHADVPPEDSQPNLELLRLIDRVPASVAPVDVALVQRYDEARGYAKAAGEAVDDALHALLMAMNGAEAATFDGGTFTYREQQRRAYQVKANRYRIPRIRWDKPKDDV